MSQAAVQLRLAGQTYRVVTSAAENELQRLAGLVEARLDSVTRPGRVPNQQSLVLAAITLAHELEEERARRKELERQHREMLESLLGRIDAVLDETGLPEEAAVRANGAHPTSASTESPEPR